VRRFKYVSILLISSAPALSCAGDSSSPTTPNPTDDQPAQVLVSPTSTTLHYIGEAIQLTAQVLNGTGAAIGVPVAWQSDNRDIATVSSSGKVLATGAGSTRVTATAGGVTAPVAVSVEQEPTEVEAEGGQDQTGVPGEVLSSPLQVRLSDQGGHPIAGAAVTWTPDPGSGVVEDSDAVSNANGEATALWRLGPGAGDQTLVVTAGGDVTFTFSAVAEAKPLTSIEVTPPAITLPVDGSVQLTATPLDSDGRVLDGQPETWISSKPLVASVSANGLVLAKAPGTATISAHLDGVSGTAIVTVSAAAVATVEIHPPGGTLQVGQSALLEAIVRDAVGNEVSDREVTWGTSNASVLGGYVLGQAAVVTGISPGIAMITATVEGKAAQAEIEVVAAGGGGGATLCSQIAGAAVVSSDGKFLGTLTSQFDSKSIYNEYGTYGSPYGSLSVNNEYGTYGSPYSSKSAFNPYASEPPVLVKNDVILAYFTVNTFKTPYVTPQLAASCGFQ